MDWTQSSQDQSESTTQNGAGTEGSREVANSEIEGAVTDNTDSLLRIGNKEENPLSL